MIFDITVLDAYILTWTVQVNGFHRAVGNTITWQQAVTNNQHVETVKSSLTYAQDATSHSTVINISVGHRLNLSTSNEKNAHNLTVLQNYFASQTVSLPKTAETSQQYKLSHTIAVTCGPGIKQKLTLSQTLGLNIVRTLTVISNYSPTSHAFAINATLGARFIAVPTPTLNFHSSGGSIKHTNVIWTFGNFTFTCRAPDFDNSEELQFSRVSRRSRAGDLIIYRDPMWPESIVLTLPYSLLGETDKNNFIYLFKLSLGKLVTYVDHWGLTWSGIILNPGEPVIQYGRDTRYKTQVKLQGGRV